MLHCQTFRGFHLFSLNNVLELFLATYSCRNKYQWQEMKKKLFQKIVQNHTRFFWSRSQTAAPKMSRRCRPFARVCEEPTSLRASGPVFHVPGPNLHILLYCAIGFSAITACSLPLCPWNRSYRTSNVCHVYGSLMMKFIWNIITSWLKLWHEISG